MKIGKRPFRVACTIGCALTIGFFMDSIHKAQHRQHETAPKATVKKDNTPLEIGQADMLPIAGIVLTSADPKADMVPKKVTRDQRLPEIPKDPQVPQLGCTSVASAMPAGHGMIQLDVLAPCQSETVVTIHHSGLVFSEVLGPDGALITTFPALTENAKVVIAFENGSGTVATAQIPDFDAIERVALQWEGAPVFSLHAQERDGHGQIWMTAEQTRTSMGSFQSLGNPDIPRPRMAEVYSFPGDAVSPSDVVAVGVEAEVTAANCNQSINAQSIEMRWNSRVRTRDVALRMPDCSAIGDFIVLNNLMEDRKIAAN